MIPSDGLRGPQCLGDAHDEACDGSPERIGYPVVVTPPASYWGSAHTESFYDAPSLDRFSSLAVATLRLAPAPRF